MAGGLAVPLLSRAARAAGQTWRVAHSAPADFALHTRLLEAADRIADRSNGQIRIEVYPDSELGSLVGLLAQVRAGTIDAVPLTHQVLAANLTVAALPMLGFASGGYYAAWRTKFGNEAWAALGTCTERLT